MRMSIVYQVNTESEGVSQANNDVEQATLIGTRRSSRVPNSRFRLQTTNEGYEFSTVEEEVEVYKNNTMGSKYTLATQEITKIESKNKSKNVEEFLCAQTAYINSLITCSELNLATQYAVKHLILTQVGMKKGIKI